MKIQVLRQCACTVTATILAYTVIVLDAFSVRPDIDEMILSPTVHTPGFDEEETVEVTLYRREVGVAKLVDACCEIVEEWRTAHMFAAWRHNSLTERRKLTLQTSVSSWLQHLVVIKLARKKADEGERSRKSVRLQSSNEHLPEIASLTQTVRLFD